MLFFNADVILLKENGKTPSLSYDKDVDDSN